MRAKVVRTREGLGAEAPNVIGGLEKSLVKASKGSSGFVGLALVDSLSSSS